MVQISQSTIFAIITLVICNFALPTIGFADFGEPCNKTVRCEPSAFLTCQNDTCQCITPDAMMYDKDLNQCVAFAGQKCRYTVGNNLDSYWYETVGCVQFAICHGENGVCTCLPDFIDHKNGTCSEKGGFDAECQNKSECRSDLSLSCIDGKCQCDTNRSVDSLVAFGDNFTRQCVGLAGKPCLHHKCTVNAHCPEFYFAPAKRAHCQCIPPFTMTSEGLCHAGHGYPCNNGSPCADEFACVDQRCQCRHPMHQVYDQYAGICKSLVWGPCNDTVDPTNPNSELEKPTEVSNMEKKVPLPSHCIEGARCVESPNGYKHCECGENFIENDAGECDLSFGAECEKEAFRKCDQKAPLSCRFGKCGCLDDLQVYEPEVRKCVGRVGSVCSNSEECVKNAKCGINKDSLGRPGARMTCACEGSSVTENRTCA